jgi:hypothetical protein
MSKRYIVIPTSLIERNIFCVGKYHIKVMEIINNTEVRIPNIIEYHEFIELISLIFTGNSFKKYFFLFSNKKKIKKTIMPITAPKSRDNVMFTDENSKLSTKIPRSINKNKNWIIPIGKI